MLPTISDPSRGTVGRQPKAPTYPPDPITSDVVGSPPFGAGSTCKVSIATSNSLLLRWKRSSDPPVEADRVSRGELRHELAFESDDELGELAGSFRKMTSGLRALIAELDRLIPVVFGPLFALTGAIGPIIGQNVGAGRYDRVRQSIMDSLKLTPT